MTTPAPTPDPATASPAGVPTLDGGSDVEEIADVLLREGAAVVRDLLPTAWADPLDEDLAHELARALRTPAGVVRSDDDRLRLEPYLERAQGVLELVAHPVVAELAEHVLGPDWRVVALGCDVALPGAPALPGTGTAAPQLPPRAVVVEAPVADLDGGHLPGTRRGDVTVRCEDVRPARPAVSTAARSYPVVTVRVAAPAEDHPASLRVSQAFHARLHRGLLRHLAVDVVATTEADLPTHRSPDGTSTG